VTCTLNPGKVMNYGKCTYILIISSILLIAANLQLTASPFSDVPPDHWAYDAVMALSSKGYMDGYLDGTFKGRKVVTRYELALILARIIEKMSKAESSGAVLDEKDIIMVKKLAKEFKGELNSLGVRVEELEGKVKKIEKELKTPKKLKIFGEYKAIQKFVQDPRTTYDDPYNYDSLDDEDKSDFQGFDMLRQYLNLKFLARPYNNVEAYFQLNGWIKGEHMDQSFFTEPHNREEFNYPTIWYIDNERNVTMKKMHFKLNAKYATVRVFAGEPVQVLTDPLKLTSSKSWIYPVYSGVEANGTFNNITYFAFLHHRDKGDSEWKGGWNLNSSKTGYSWFSPNESQYDTAGFRATIEVPKRYMKDSSLVFGTTYLEYMKDYVTQNRYNRIYGGDISYKNTKEGNLNVVTELLHSDDGIDGDGLLKDLAHKLDITYQLKQFTYTLNYYKYGRKFRVRTAEEKSMFIEIQDGWNFGRDTGKYSELFSKGGETCFRAAVKYDYDNKPGERDFKIEGIGLVKYWEQDPDNIMESDYYRGQLYSVEMWLDLTKNMNLRGLLKLTKDAKPDEVGTGYTEWEIKTKFYNGKVDGKAKVWLERDADEENLNGKGATNYGIYGELSSKITDKIFIKGTFEHKVEKDGFTGFNVDPSNLTSSSKKRDNTEKSQTEAKLETTIDITKQISVTARAEGRWEHWPYFAGLDKDTYWLVGEIKNDITERLKSKSVYWWKRVRDETWPGTHPAVETYTNVYSEIIYDATDKTKVKFTYGDWISTNKDDREAWDYPSIETEKKMLLEVTTEF